MRSWNARWTLRLEIHFLSGCKSSKSLNRSLPIYTARPLPHSYTRPSRQCISQLIEPTATNGIQLRRIFLWILKWVDIVCDGSIGVIIPLWEKLRLSWVDALTPRKPHSRTKISIGTKMVAEVMAPIRISIRYHIPIDRSHSIHYLRILFSLYVASVLLYTLSDFSLIYIRNELRKWQNETRNNVIVTIENVIKNCGTVKSSQRETIYVIKYHWACGTFFLYSSKTDSADPCERKEKKCHWIRFKFTFRQKSNTVSQLD